MSIKKGTTWNHTEGRYEGCIDFGPNLPLPKGKSPHDLASESLFFVLVGLRGRWKIPVSYFNINKIAATFQARLVETVLEWSGNHNIKVRVITADGTHTNPSTMEKLGCAISEKMEGKLSEEFTRGESIWFMYDSCHMLKLARNAIGDLKSFVDGEGKLVRWQYFEELHKLQRDEGLKLANKLSVRHIDYHKLKMNVSLAGQSLSQSVADAFLYLQSFGVEQFADCEGTVNFILKMNRLFDLLNSRSPFASGYKRPLSLQWMPEWKEALLDSIHYLEGLRESPGGTLLLNGRRKVFVVGFIVTAKSTLAVATELLTRTIDPFKYVLTYKFSQDHIELLFR